MSYRIVWRAAARNKVSSWRLPDAVMVDVYLRADQLAEQPARLLVRLQEPFDGMVYPFSLIDPDNRLAEYEIALHVLYGTDEQTLFIVNGSCRARYGM